IDMGYRRFILTPNTGDVFMDRHLFERLAFLEGHPQVQDYTFYTNFTIPRPKDIERLTTLTKFRHPTISVYGHDRESFVAIAKAPEKLYDRLVANLEQLLALRLAGRLPFTFTIALRSTRHVPSEPTSDLLKVLERFRETGIDVRISRLYHDWGGQVTEDDIKHLDIDMVDSTKAYKNGPCALLFTGVQVMATGIVHACACVDVDAQLEIGNLNDKPLREIVSPDNPAYMALIAEQQNGVFKPVCQGCGFYKSIYHNRSVYRKDGIATQTVDDFKQRLAGKCAAATPLPAAAE
ncbi:MAG: SPASM domain-containing protein, partial [Xanthobacteraceae bacterium]